MINKLTFINGECSDYLGSIWLDHKYPEQTTLIQSYNEYKLLLSGCLLIQNKTDGIFFFGQEASSYVRNEHNVPLSDFILWLQSSKDIPELEESISVLSNPWFEWIDHKGNCIGDAFDVIYTDKEKNINTLKETINLLK